MKHSWKKEQNETGNEFLSQTVGEAKKNGGSLSFAPPVI